MGAVRGMPATWKDWRLSETGLMAHMSQSAGAWYVRGLERVKAAFERVWESDELIVSMDAVLAWRPWQLDEAWRPRTEGLHIDQNPFSKPGLDCVQGMMPLIDVTHESGGLQVVPRSHCEEAKQAYRERYPHMVDRGDWCVLDPEDPLQERGVLLLASAGDLILWDSRTVHGGLVGRGCAPDDEPSLEEGVARQRDLARLSVTVAMTPRCLANAEVQRLRCEGFAAGESFNHCPHEAGTSSGTIKRKLPRACGRL